MSARNYTSRNVIAGYLTVYTLFTLASSVIWAINTIFLMREGGLTIFQVMIVNTVFTVGQMVFEVPTGVVADTIGRKASLLLAMVTLAVSTLMYVLTPGLGMGHLGLHRSQRDPGAGLHVPDRRAGRLAGGRARRHRLGRGRKRGCSPGVRWPPAEACWWARCWEECSARSACACPTWSERCCSCLRRVAVLVLVRDVGSRPVRCTASTSETRPGASCGRGSTFGWRSRVVRPLLWSLG